MSPNVTWLSHPLSTNTPAYGGGEGMRIESITKITEGQTANSSRFILPNHLGTHVDAPRHFFEKGPALTDYPPEFWIFKKPLLLDIPCKDGYLITPNDLKGRIPEETDLLLIRTGYETYRNDDRYWEHNPGLAPELGTWIRKNYKNIRSIGMDLISVTSRHHREEGREAHRILLDPDTYGNPVLPVEDMSLEHVNKPLSQVIISPLRVMDSNSGLCTVFGLF